MTVTNWIVFHERLLESASLFYSIYKYILYIQIISIYYVYTKFDLEIRQISFTFLGIFLRVLVQVLIYEFKLHEE